MNGIQGPIGLTPRGEGGVSVLLLPRAQALPWLGVHGVRKAPEPGEILFVRIHLLKDGALDGPEAEVEALLVGTPEGEWVEVHLPGNPSLFRALEEGGEEGNGQRVGSLSPLEEECLRVAQRSPTSRGAALALSQLGEEGWVSQVGLGHSANLGSPALLEVLREALERGARLEGLFHPTRIVLRGPTNAGKSTLFNLLLGVERVRTGPQAGLTLDPVSESVEGLGWPFVLTDTAGERELDEGLEQEAVRFGRELTSGSLLVEVRSLTGSGGKAWGNGVEGPSLRFFTYANRRKRDPKPYVEGSLKRLEGDPCFDLKRADPDLVRTVFFQRVLEVLGRTPFPETQGRRCLLTSRQKTLVQGILETEDALLRGAYLEKLKGGLS